MSSFTLEGLYTNNSLLFTCFEMASQFFFFTEVAWVSALRNNKSLLKSVLMKNEKKKKGVQKLLVFLTLKLLSFIFKNFYLPIIYSQRAPDSPFTLIYTNLRFKASLSHWGGQASSIQAFQKLEHLPTELCSTAANFCP